MHTRLDFPSTQKTVFHFCKYLDIYSVLYTKITTHYIDYFPGTEIPNMLDIVPYRLNITKLYC